MEARNVQIVLWRDGKKIFLIKSQSNLSGEYFNARELADTERKSTHSSEIDMSIFKLTEENQEKGSKQ